MVPAALSQVLAVQPILDAIDRDKATPRSAFDHLKVGQMLEGLVKSQTKGISLVEIEGQAVAMRLPSQVATGDTLKLRFAGHMPQPVFVLENPEASISDKPQLSSTARMLSDIMQRVPERTLPTLTPTAPLLDQPTPAPTDLAIALRSALVRSGLFYESHLANWVAGKDSLEGLMKEPQNRLATDNARTATALLSPDSSGLAEQKVANPLHGLLAQQLQVLESPHFAWRGEVWPGMPLEWEIRQEAEHPPDAQAQAEPAGQEAGWESHLKLTLPQLGELDVHIRLDAQQAFNIRIAPRQPEVASLLKQNQANLASQLDAAGCALQAFSVEHDANT